MYFSSFLTIKTLNFFFLLKSLLTIQNIIIYDKIFILENITSYCLIIGLDFYSLSSHSHFYWKLFFLKIKSHFESFLHKIFCGIRTFAPMLLHMIYISIYVYIYILQNSSKIHLKVALIAMCN